MSLNTTPAGDRVHIGFFGRRNAGKSSVVNAVTGQNLAIVSDVRGTTTDPVYKAMELLPLGPVMIIDTPGFDDEGKLGQLRVEKTRQVLRKTDVAVLIMDSTAEKSTVEEDLIGLFDERHLPYIIVRNKSDLLEQLPVVGEKEIYVSATEGTGIWELKERIAGLAETDTLTLQLVGDLIAPGDHVILVIPIDKAAPKGRLILPQQQVIRDILEAGGIVSVVKETELREALELCREKPVLVITDSQVFERVSAEVPEDIFLTSFSILMSRYKGFLHKALDGVEVLKSLKSGDRVLIAEGCTHHRQCNDIGTVKIPGWLKKYTGAELKYDICSGTEFPEDISSYSLVIHCGGCMLNRREICYRAGHCEEQRVPIINYGLLIAYFHGILERSIAIFTRNK